MTGWTEYTREGFSHQLSCGEFEISDFNNLVTKVSLLSLMEMVFFPLTYNPPFLLSMGGLRWGRRHTHREQKGRK